MKNYWFIVFTAALLLSSCQPAGTPTTPPSSTPSDRETQTHSSTITPAVPPPTPVETPALNGEALNPHGPWLVFTHRDENGSGELWAINADGTGLTRLFDLEREEYSMAAPKNLNLGAAPTGGKVAFTTWVEDYRLSDTQLHLITLPDGDNQFVSPLGDSVPAVEQSYRLFGCTDACGGNPWPDITSLAWSPDGRQLAFLSAHDGPSTDVYTYTSETSTITRLTDGPDEAVSPLWTPDGSQVIHTSAKGTTVWAANADGSGAATLFNPQGSLPIFLGWVGTDQLVTYDYQYNCPTGGNLRLYELTTGNTTTLWENCFLDLTYDLDNSVFLIQSFQSDERCEEPKGSCTYLVNTDGESALLVSSETRSDGAIWVPSQNSFHMLADDLLYTVSLSGKAVPVPLTLPTYSLPAVSPDGRWWALGRGSSLCFDNVQDPAGGLWVGPYSQTPQFIGEVEAGKLVWSPDSQTLFIFGDDGLYVAHAPNFEPFLISAEIILKCDQEFPLNQFSSITWVWP